MDKEKPPIIVRNEADRGDTFLTERLIAQRDADVEWYEARMQIILDTHYADYVRVDVQQARQVAV